MNRRELAKEICRREAGKREVNVAQVTEIIKHICDIMCEWEERTGEPLKIFKRKKK